MPNDDITHPVPDLTGYITEGRLFLIETLTKLECIHQYQFYHHYRGYEGWNREGYTRSDHSAVANQLFACYARVQEARSLASVIGEEELSEIDKAYMSFGVQFEKSFVAQGFDENRSIEETLELGWDLLCLLPKSEIDRVDEKLLDEKYDTKRAEGFRNIE